MLRVVFETPFRRSDRLDAVLKFLQTEATERRYRLWRQYAHVVHLLRECTEEHRTTLEGHGFVTYA